MHRKDEYNDNLNNMLDENIEELAKLTALKQRIQNLIFDGRKQHNELTTEIKQARILNSSLQTQLKIAEEQ